MSEFDKINFCIKSNFSYNSALKGDEEPSEPINLINEDFEHYLGETNDNTKGELSQEMKKEKKEENIINEIKEDKPKKYSPEEILQIFEKNGVSTNDVIKDIISCQIILEMDKKFERKDENKQKTNGTKNKDKFIGKKRKKVKESPKDNDHHSSKNKNQRPLSKDKGHNFLSEDNVMRRVIIYLFQLLIISSNKLFFQVLGEKEYKEKIQNYYKKHCIHKKGKKDKELVKKIAYNQKSSLKIIKIEELFEKTLGEVLSLERSSKYDEKYISKEYNKEIIDDIKNNVILKKYLDIKFKVWINFFTFKNDIGIEGEEWAQKLLEFRAKNLLDLKIDEGKKGEGKNGKGKNGKGKNGKGKNGEGKNGKGKKNEGEKDEGEKDEGKNDEGKKGEGKNDEGKNDEGKNDEGKNDEGKNDEEKKNQFFKFIYLLFNVEFLFSIKTPKKKKDYFKVIKDPEDTLTSLKQDIKNEDDNVSYQLEDNFLNTTMYFNDFVL
jgi:hypothetical protein